MKPNVNIPEGYMKDASNRLVPIESVRDIDIERNAVVLAVVNDAVGLQEIIREWQTRTLNNIRAFCSMSAERFNVKWGGNKGNISLTSYDGQYNVKIAVAEYIDFDERIIVAKELIDDCLLDWAEGSRTEIRTIIGDAFSAKDGKLNAKKILELRKFKFEDSRWIRALDAIAESITIAGSKEYIRIYRKDDKGKMIPISLDGANL